MDNNKTENLYKSAAEQCLEYRADMDFAGNHYYRINRILLTCLGLWPYYTQRMKYVYCIFLFLLLLSNIIFQVCVNPNKSMFVYG